MGSLIRRFIKILQENKDHVGYNMSLDEIENAWNSGTMSIVDVDAAIREYWYKELENPLPIGPLGPISRTSLFVSGIPRKTWEFVAKIIKKLQNNEIAQIDAEYALMSGEARKLKEKALKEGLSNRKI
jgi:hypothetical protein